MKTIANTKAKTQEKTEKQKKPNTLNRNDQEKAEKEQREKVTREQEERKEARKQEKEAEQEDSWTDFEDGLLTPSLSLCRPPRRHCQSTRASEDEAKAARRLRP